MAHRMYIYNRAHITFSREIIRQHAQYFNIYQCRRGFLAVNIFSLSKTVQPNNNNSSHRLHDQQEWQKGCQRLFSTDDAQTKPNPMVLPNSWHSLCIFVHKSSYILCFVHNDSYIFWGCPFKRTLFTGNIYIAIYISVISFYPVFEPCPR